MTRAATPGGERAGDGGGPPPLPALLGTEDLHEVDSRARALLGPDPLQADELLSLAVDRLERAVREGPRVAGVAADVDLDHWRAQLLYARAAQRHYRNEPKALVDLQLAADIVDAERSPLLASLVLNGRAIWEGFEGRVEDQVVTLTRALDVVSRVDGQRALAVRGAVRINLAEVLADVGDSERALGLLTAALPDTRVLGDPEQLEQIHSTAVRVAGQWLVRPDGVDQAPHDRAERVREDVQLWAAAAAEAAEAAARRDPVVSNRRHATYALARAAHLRGETDEALRLAQEAVRLTEERGEPDHLVRCRALAGELLVARGHHEEALEQLQQVVAGSGVVATASQLTSWYLVADCLEALGRHREAMSALHEYVRHSGVSRDLRLRNTAAMAAVTLMRERAEQERDLARRDGQEARRLARVDPLTGVGNRLAFEDALAGLAAAGSPTCLALLDLDHFKVVNDVHGHLVGDEVLRSVAAEVTAVLAEADAGARVFRIGGEEFAAVLTHDEEAPRAGAVQTLELVRRRVAALEVRTATATITLTLSAGLAVGVVGTLGDSTHRALLSHADQNLYRAKRRGRDRVVAD
ncbi:diguanylate cyclase [Aquipuribacter nitratireducens]|uniref:Diguanylate cyclase n=1 Tax=Aquipuribacter nitratireducens TaxID=650104 RepID=A0ABW0GS15_9MICO